MHFDAPAPTPANRAASDLEPTGRGGEVRSRSSRTSKIKSMRAARQAKHELLAAAQGGKLATPSKITIEALPDQWLNSKQRLARKTRDDYARHVRLHIVPLLGAMRLHELTPAKLSAFYSELSKQGKGTPTQQKVHVVLWCCTAR
ncbi:N-terminal phage integrase SAM-like domain-containing protein [Deinococcus yavapaiensis]|nr:N-terminal phage integrase SAM-like domain-containing protein [Deinococcus yavapaiensis]